MADFNVGVRRQDIYETAGRTIGDPRSSEALRHDPDVVFYDWDCVDRVFQVVKNSYPSHWHLLEQMRDLVRREFIAAGAAPFAQIVVERHQGHIESKVREHMEAYFKDHPTLALLRGEVNVKEKLITKLTETVVQQKKELEDFESKMRQAVTRMQDAGLGTVIDAVEHTNEWEAERASRNRIVDEAIEQIQRHPKAVNMRMPIEKPSNAYKGVVFFVAGVALTYLAQAFIPILRI